MGWKSRISIPYASYIAKNVYRVHNNCEAIQKSVLQHLIKLGRKTQFGNDHGFDNISSYEDFKKNVPVAEYESIKNYIERILQGEKDVLWPGIPIYFAKTSGTTSGAKYIPLTDVSIKTHINAARNALLTYIYNSGKSEFVDGKMIFLQGSPRLNNDEIIPTGRLSGIVANHVPSYLQSNRMPSYSTNCIEDWEEKVQAIVKETAGEDMRLISGIPPWVQMYFEKLLEYTGKKNILEIFPNFSLLVYGGVNYHPYEMKMQELIGGHVDSIELFPASEGFIAFQDDQSSEGMLLNIDAGMFYEFIPVDEIGKSNPKRLSLTEVKLGVNYAIIISSNAGLWAYDLGDTVKFVSLEPHRVLVTGRTKHFTSAFGEHVIAEEVESSLSMASSVLNIQVNEFHVAPQVKPKDNELPYHEWLIEFSHETPDLNQLRAILEKEMRRKNPYYDDLIKGQVLQELKITVVPNKTFQLYMKSQGKLGGQNKLPRLANDRKIADEILKITST